MQVLRKSSGSKARLAAIAASAALAIAEIAYMSRTRSSDGLDSMFLVVMPVLWLTSMRPALACFSIVVLSVLLSL